VVEATFESPTGARFTRDVVRHPGAVAVVPVTDRGTALLLRQYRGPLERALLEIPAGTRDQPGEPPEDTARRELAEELGVRAAHLQHLATIANTPGFCDEVTELYLATGLSYGDHERHGEEETHMSVEEVALADVDAIVGREQIADAQTVLGLMLARAALAHDAGADRVQPEGPSGASGGG